jgi:tetratricopeptide (TPR) repeat protein
MYLNINRIGKLIFVSYVLWMIVSCNSQNNTVSNNAKDSVVVLPASAEEISRQIEKEPDNAELYYRRAQIYFNEKYLDRAQDDISQASAMAKDNPLYYFTKGRILYAMNRTAEAAKMYESAITLKPDYDEAQMKLAELYCIVKEHRKSIDLLNLVIARSKRTDAYFFRGMNQKEAGDTAKAIASFQLAYELDASNYDAAMQLGLLYAAKKNKIALDYFAAAIKLNPKSSEAYFGRAYYYQLSGNFQKALSDYKKVIDIDPSNAKAYYNVGYINYEAGRYKVALRSWDICIQMNNEYLEAYYMRGLLHEYQKEFDDARMNYSYALQLQPDYELAKAGLSRVKGK